MKQVLKLSYLVLFFSISISTFAQFSITGNIKDSLTREPVTFAKVVLVSLKDSSKYSTNVETNGNFSFKGYSRGGYLIQISFLGYETFKKQVRLFQNVDLGNIYLKQDSKIL